jgi:hypothetical protein
MDMTAPFPAGVKAVFPRQYIMRAPPAVPRQTAIYAGRRHVVQSDIIMKYFKFLYSAYRAFVKLFPKDTPLPHTGVSRLSWYW